MFLHYTERESQKYTYIPIMHKTNVMNPMSTNTQPHRILVPLPLSFCHYLEIRISTTEFIEKIYTAEHFEILKHDHRSNHISGNFFRRFKSESNTAHEIVGYCRRC